MMLPDCDCGKFPHSGTCAIWSNPHPGFRRHVPVPVESEMRFLNQHDIRMPLELSQEDVRRRIALIKPQPRLDSTMPRHTDWITCNAGLSIIDRHRLHSERSVCRTMVPINGRTVPVFCPSCGSRVI